MKLLKLYERVRLYLATHKKLSFILSHGGLHLAVLIVILIGIIFFSVDIVLGSRREYTVTDLVISESNCRSGYIDTLQIVIEPHSNKWFVEHYSMRVNGAFSLSELPEMSHEKENAMIIETTGLLHFNYGTRAIATTTDKDYDDYKVFGITRGDTVGNRIVTKAWTDVHPIYASVSGFTGHTIGSPYHMFKINIRLDGLIPRFNDGSSVVVNLAGDNNRDDVISFDHVYPTPTDVEFNRVVWRGKEDMERILSVGGIFVDARDVRLAYKAERMNLLYNILLGALIAFALDIIVQLIYKWRKLKA